MNSVTLVFSGGAQPTRQMDASLSRVVAQAFAKIIRGAELAVAFFHKSRSTDTEDLIGARDTNTIETWVSRYTAPRP